MTKFWAEHERMRLEPPFDLPSNPRGFPPGRASCESAHVPLLSLLAENCSTVVELGCRDGFSTVAILAGLSRSPLPGPKSLLSVDRDDRPVHGFLRENLPEGVSWSMLKGDVLEVEIPPCDWLHVDDLHAYSHVRAELARHGAAPSKYLSFHDTVSQGEKSLDRPSEEGILRAVDEFTAVNGWALCYECFFNHGLRVYRRAG